MEQVVANNVRFISLINAIRKTIELMEMINGNTRILYAYEWNGEQIIFKSNMGIGFIAADFNGPVHTQWIRLEKLFIANKLKPFKSPKLHDDKLATLMSRALRR